MFAALAFVGNIIVGVTLRVLQKGASENFNFYMILQHRQS
jgi:hypothetical protein